MLSVQCNNHRQFAVLILCSSLHLKMWRRQESYCESVGFTGHFVEALAALTANTSEWTEDQEEKKKSDLLLPSVLSNPSSLHQIANMEMKVKTTVKRSRQ